MELHLNCLNASSLKSWQLEDQHKIHVLAGKSREAFVLQDIQQDCIDQKAAEK
jgi:hypothetical protein